MPTAKNTDNTTNQAKCFVIIGLTYFFIQISFSDAYLFYTIMWCYVGRLQRLRGPMKHVI